MRMFLIQVIGFVPSVIAITSLQSPDRKKILKLQFLCSFMWFVHYWSLGAVTFALTNVINIVRAILCYYNDQPWANKKWIPVTMIVVYWISAAMTWKGLSSFLPTLAMTLTTIALWNHDMKLTRLLFVLNSPLMLMADLVTGSYSTAMIESIALVSFVIAVYRYDIRPTKMNKAIAD